MIKIINKTKLISIHQNVYLRISKKIMKNIKIKYQSLIITDKIQVQACTKNIDNYINHCKLIKFHIKITQKNKTIVNINKITLLKNFYMNIMIN